MSRVEPIYSSLGGDPVLGEIVKIFVEEVPSRVETLVSQASADDWEALGRTAHQLKGAFGSHGFDQLTPIVTRLEAAARQDSPEEESILQSLDELIAMCKRLRPGTPKAVAPSGKNETP